MSFKALLVRIDRSIARQQKQVKELQGQRQAIAPRLGEKAMLDLDRALGLHLERVEGTLEALVERRGAVLELIEKSPELPLGPGRELGLPERPAGGNAKKR